MKVSQLPLWEDNYVYVLELGGSVVCVDPGHGVLVKNFLDSRGLGLDYILTTHHHADHVGGNLYLKNAYNCKIIGPYLDRDRIPGIDIAVDDSDCLDIADVVFKAYSTPGHTRGHCVYYVERYAKLFVGDTLFAMGCGRLFEGTAFQMWNSLSKLIKLPPETMVYCAHEYTLANGRFALTIEPDNKNLRKRFDGVQATRAKGQPTVPFLLKEELATNPFLRADQSNIRQRLGVEDASDAEVFQEIRRRKDVF